MKNWGEAFANVTHVADETAANTWVAESFIAKMAGDTRVIVEPTTHEEPSEFIR